VSESRHKVPVVSEEGAVLSEVSVSVSVPDRGAGAGASSTSTAAILAHGAGGNMDSPAIVGLQKRLAAAGISAVRFNFPYSEKRKKGPDKQPVLVACWRSVAEWTRNELSPKRLFLGGRSMGGRMVSYLVAEGYACDGVFFVAYPLHPPGKREQQRKDHLPGIRAPMLFVSGTRDAFAGLDLLEPLVKRLGARLHLVEGADHGFKVPKSAGRKPQEIEDEVARTVLAFIESPGS
jgi:uncharacterized protein